MTDQPRDLNNKGRDTEQRAQYPPIKTDEDQDSSPGASTPRTMASTVTLPSIHDQYHFGGAGADRERERDGGRGPGSRGGSSYSSSPNAVNGYPPPPGRQSYLPPLQPPTNPRSPTYPPDPRDDHYRQGPAAAPYHPGQYYGAYGPGGPQAGPYGPYGGLPPPNGYAAATIVPIPQAAPRQRTSIACKYCRKRKVGKRSIADSG